MPGSGYEENFSMALAGSGCPSELAVSTELRHFIRPICWRTFMIGEPFGSVGSFGGCGVLGGAGVLGG